MLSKLLAKMMYVITKWSKQTQATSSVNITITRTLGLLDLIKHL